MWTKIAKVVRKIVRGGDAADAFADNVQDVRTLFGAGSSWHERLLAGLSLASEVLPASASDVKDVARWANKADNAADAAKRAKAAAAREQRAQEKAAAAAGTDGVFQVTPQGVVLPKDPKYKIPANYIENEHRPGSYGEKVNGKYQERLRIDPATPPGQKGPNTSHYHLDGKGAHLSPAPGNKDPGFQK